MAALVVVPGIVTTVTLNRPEVRNALDPAMIGELDAWARALPRDGRVRAVVLRGAGPVFSAGADFNALAAMADVPYEENLEDARRTARMLLAIDSLPVPVIGRVHGAAIGGGAGLAALCDIVIAADDAVFGYTETRIGLVPAMIAPYLVRKIGLSAARALCLDGARFPAASAREIGLVHEVVPAADLDAAVERRAAALLNAAPGAVAATKALLREVHGRRPEDVLALTAETIARQRISPEGREGVRAFLEKRPAAWVPPDR
jgi:methylglutaconyl-CoA hydratase